MKDSDFLIELQIEFAENIHGRLQGLEQLILTLEKQQSEEKINQSIRYLLAEFHSIKGSAGALQFRAIQMICHQVEDVIIGQQEFGIKSQVDGLLKYCDMINEYAQLFKKERNVNQDDFLKKHHLFLKKESEMKNSIKEKSQRPSQVIRVLSVGLSLTIINNLKKAAANFQFTMAFTNSSSEALARIAIEDFDLIFSSYFTEPVDGITLCMAIKNQWRNKSIKFVLFPSQDISQDYKKLLGDLLPDKIIFKNQNMYQEFSTFCDQHFKPKSVIKKILFLDDESSLLELYQAVIEGKTQCQLYFLNPKEQSLKNILKFLPDLIVSDINMPGINVLELMDDPYANSNKLTKFVFLTGDIENPICHQLLAKGALGIFDKANIIESLLSDLARIGVELR